MSGPEAGGEWLPGLRPGVTLSVAADGTGVLLDPLLGRRIKLDARGVALCGGLAGGPREVAELAAAAGTTADAVRAFASKITALDLCATERAGVRAAERSALAAVRAAPAMHLRPLPGARFACTMCGSCCGGHNVGPVSEAVLDGLEETVAAIGSEIRVARRLDKDLFVTLPGAVPEAERATAGRDVMCHASNGSCVFLDDLGKCRIHSAVGGDKKPLPCRIFPWELVATPTGVRVSVQRECRDFVRAIGDDAPPIDLAREELAGLVAAVAAIGELPAARPLPVVRGQAMESWAAWEALEARLMAVVDADDGVDAGRLFAKLFALLPSSSSAVPGSASPGELQLGRFGDWRDRLVSILKQMIAAAPPANARMVIRTDSARIAIAALEAGRGWVLARALEPLPAAAAHLFKEHLRHALWATTPLRASSVEAGLGRMLAEWVLARLVAITRAREVKRFHLTEQDLQDGLVTASFLSRHEDLLPVLAELDALTVAVFVDGLERFVAHAADDDEPDRRIELVKF